MLKKSISHSIQNKSKEEILLSFIEKAMKKTRSVGISLAIIEDSKIVYQNGFGVRTLGSQHKVTPETMMMIGSTTKPLTAMCIAKGIEKGLFTWQSPVQTFYPAFKVNDATLSETIRLEQLLNAASGMPRKDLAFFLNHQGKTAEDLLALISHIAPTQKPNTQFQYINHLVSAAGYMTGALYYPKLSLQEAYFKAMQELIFSPLNMKRTTFSFEKVLLDENHASPHGQDILGNTLIIPEDNELGMRYLAPSGGAWSTVSDLAQFMLTELNDGMMPNGEQLIEPINISYRRKPQISVENKVDYGICWFIQDSEGLKRIHHAGRTMGFSAFFSFFPEIKSGIIMLSNCVTDVVLHEAIHTKLLEIWFGKDFGAENKIEDYLEAQQKQISACKNETQDSAFLSRFIGTYQNDEIADFSICKIDEDIVLQTECFSTPLLQKTNEQGQKVLVGTLPPWTWINLELVPTQKDGSAFTLSLRDEYYEFNRVSYD